MGDLLDFLLGVPERGQDKLVTEPPPLAKPGQVQAMLGVVSPWSIGRYLEEAAEKQKNIPPTHILIEMEEAIAAMHGKDYDHYTLMADLVLCVVDPDFREEAWNR